MLCNCDCFGRLNLTLLPPFHHAQKNVSLESVKGLASLVEMGNFWKEQKKESSDDDDDDEDESDDEDE